MKKILSKLRYPSAILFVDRTILKEQYQDSVKAVYEAGAESNYKVLHLVNQQPELLENTVVLDVHIRAWGLTLDFLPEQSPKYRMNVHFHERQENGAENVQWHEWTLKKLLQEFAAGKVKGVYIEKLIWLPQNFKVASA